jgi:hypothetical protein
VNNRLRFQNHLGAITHLYEQHAITKAIDQPEHGPDLCVKDSKVNEDTQVGNGETEPEHNFGQDLASSCKPSNVQSDIPRMPTSTPKRTRGAAKRSLVWNHGAEAMVDGCTYWECRHCQCCLDPPRDIVRLAKTSKVLIECDSRE